MISVKKKNFLNYCGLLEIVALLSYTVAVVFSPLDYPGYNWMAQAVSDKKAFTQLMIERAVLEKLGAGCHEPIGVLADMGSEDTLDLRLMTVINEQLIYRQVEGKKTDWEDMIDKICKA